MKVFKLTRWFFVLLGSLVCVSAQAEFYEEAEGVKVYAGMSAGGFVLDVDDGGSAEGGSVGLQAGFEEGLWAVEAKWFVFRTAEDIEDKTSDMLASYSWVYRRPVEFDTYMKYKIGYFTYEEGEVSSHAPVIGVGYGWRLEGPHRLELEYEYTPHDIDTRIGTIDFGIHMITLQYLFGGSTPRFDY